MLRLEDFPERQVAAPCAMKRRLIGFDAVKHLLLARIERRKPCISTCRAILALPLPFVAATRRRYATLLAGGFPAN